MAAQGMPVKEKHERRRKQSCQVSRRKIKTTQPDRSAARGTGGRGRFGVPRAVLRWWRHRIEAGFGRHKCEEDLDQRPGHWHRMSLDLGPQIPRRVQGTSSYLRAVCRGVLRDARTNCWTITAMPDDRGRIVDIGFKKLAIHQISYSGLGTMSGGPLGGAGQKSQYKIDCRWSPDASAGKWTNSTRCSRRSKSAATAAPASTLQT